MKLFLSTTSLALCLTSAWAETTLNPVFTDHMVIQRDIPAKLFGTAKDGEKITVSIAGQQHQTVAKDGEWLVKLNPVKAGGGPLTLTVQGDNKIVLNDILFGDVWICGGQSNMAMSLAGHLKNKVAGPKFTAAYEKEKSSPGLRLLRIDASKAAKTQQKEVPIFRVFENSWQTGGSEQAKSFSAVGYGFGAQLHQHLKVPIGMIESCRGATSVQEWMSDDALTEAGAAAGKANFYNSMIAPLQKLSIKGVIWYQGESNSGNMEAITHYEKLFKTCISSWRKQWGQGDFPFLFVQLAGYAKVPHATVHTRWPYLREVQEKALELPNTGMALAYDRGSGNIHPPYKFDVATRLYSLARTVAYNEKVVSEGPYFKSYKIQENQVIIDFENCGAGLTPMAIDLEVKLPADQLKGFYLAGQDKRFYKANATIKGTKVLLTHPDVSQPVAARYAWHGFPKANLYNKEGFPARPFRTDEWNDPMQIRMPEVYWGASNDGIKRILCYGDSITRGTYLDGKYQTKLNWVSLAQDLAPDSIKFINAGRSGRRTSDLRELEGYFKNNRQVDHAILFLGVNDLRVSNEVTLKACVENTKKSINRLRQVYGNNLEVTILSSPGLSVGNISKRFYSKGYNEKEHAMLDKLRKEYDQLAKNTNCQYLDLWGSVSKENFTDGLHPNKQGQTQIAEKVWQHLKK